MQIADPVQTKGRGLLIASEPHYFFPLLEAFSGLIFLPLAVSVARETCVAMLQWPLFHFRIGSGKEVQYQPDEN